MKRMKNFKIAAIVLAVVTLTSLALTAGLANAAVQIMDGGPSPATGANMPVQAYWIRLNGIITKWGTTDVRGALSVQTRTAILASADTRKFTQASAIWTTNITRAISAVKSKENFTYTFYAARLWNPSVSTLSASALSASATNFFLNGTWNVNTVKSTITIITNDNGDIVRVHRDSTTDLVKVYGELNVTNGWTKFTLQLTGYDPLTGSVTRSVTRQTQFNFYKVTDDATGTIVTKADLNTIVKCYGAMPGWGNYDNAMDFNYNYKIDIADLATVAANM
jgi:hypothetical protein